MKRNLLYISIIVFLLILIMALIIAILCMKNKPKIILPSPVIIEIEKEVIVEKTDTESEPKIEPQYPEFLKYGIKPKEAKYYE